VQLTGGFGGGGGNQGDLVAEGSYTVTARIGDREFTTRLQVVKGS
jgi:hypothetical protein